MDDLQKRIRDVMSVVLEVDSSEITENAGPGVIENWDSLRHMSLVLALEEEFNIRFPDETIEQLISFQLIELNVRELLNVTTR